MNTVSTSTPVAKRKRAPKAQPSPPVIDMDSPPTLSADGGRITLLKSSFPHEDNIAFKKGLVYPHIAIKSYRPNHLSKVAEGILNHGKISALEVLSEAFGSEIDGGDSILGSAFQSMPVDELFTFMPKQLWSVLFAALGVHVTRIIELSLDDEETGFCKAEWERYGSRSHELQLELIWPEGEAR